MRHGERGRGRPKDAARLSERRGVPCTGREVFFDRSDVRGGTALNEFAADDTVRFDLFELDVIRPTCRNWRGGRHLKKTVYSHFSAFLSLRPFWPEPSPKPWREG